MRSVGQGLGASLRACCACGPAPGGTEEDDADRGERSAAVSGATATCQPDGQDLYSWPSADELAQVGAMREALDARDKDTLSEAPKDIQHDLWLCRFLRGWGGSLPKAIKAFKAHLAFRRKFAATITRARAAFSPEAQDFDGSLVLGRPELLKQFSSVTEIPAEAGTNDGMPVSLMVLRFFNIREFGQNSQEELVEWMISMMEQRCVVLHNRSLKEHRVVKTVEAKDCMGFSFSQLLASPRLLMTLSRVFSYGDMYPEMLGAVVLFNLDPGMRMVRLIQRMIRLLCKDALKKCVFAEVADWSTSVCSPRSPSPLMLPLYADHVSDLSGERWQELTADRPLAVLSDHVTAGASCSWQVSCRGSPDLDCAPGSLPSCRVSAWLFAVEAGQPPDVSPGGGEPLLLLAKEEGSSCSGTLTAERDGVVLIEVLLWGANQESTALAVHLSLEVEGSPGKESTPRSASCEPSSRNSSATGEILAGAGGSVRREGRDGFGVATGWKGFFPALSALFERSEVCLSATSDNTFSVAWVVAFIAVWMALHALAERTFMAQ